MTYWADVSDDEEFQNTVSPWVIEELDKSINPIVYGDPVGIKSVQHVLMSATQISLSHFHTAGMFGLETGSYGGEVRPSLADLLNHRYSRNNTGMKFSTSLDVYDARKYLVGSQLKDFVKSIGSSLTLLKPKDNIWYKINGLTMDDNIIRYYLDYRKIRQFNLTLDEIASKIFEGYVYKVSPDFMGMIDVTVVHLYIETFLSKLGNKISGTPNILSCDECGDGNIKTKGSDILHICKIKGINKNSLISNNIHEVEKYYGIEAATYMLNTLIGNSTISNFMTRTGNVLPFAKSSKEVVHRGLLTAIGFERPKDDIKKALIHPKHYKGSSIYSNLMTGDNPINIFRITKSL